MPRPVIHLYSSSCALCSAELYRLEFTLFTVEHSHTLTAHVSFSAVGATGFLFSMLPCDPSCYYYFLTQLITTLADLGVPCILQTGSMYMYEFVGSREHTLMV